MIAVPTLGKLRDLPPADVSSSVADRGAGRSRDGGNLPTVLFTALGLLAAGLFLAAAFCAVNWATISVPVTTESHIEQFRGAYQEVSSAQMIREWEDINKYGIDLPVPYQYRTMELDKQSWGRSALIFVGLGAAAVMGAGLMTGRGPSQTA